MNQLSDFEIIDLILDGQEDKYAVLVDRYKNYVYSIAINIIKNNAEAEEIAQEAFIKAYKNLTKFNKNAKFGTWVYRITFNTAITYKNKSKGHLTSGLDNEIVASIENENELESEQRRKYIAMAMQELSDEDAMALTMFYLKEMTLEEICETTNISLSNIKVRLHRARKRFSIALNNLLNEEIVNL